MTDQTRQIIELRKQGKNYDEIVIILGCKMKSVRNVVREYHCSYQDIENAWKNKVADLRRAGKTYTECAEILGTHHDRVEQYCRYNGLKYEDLNQSIPVTFGWHGRRYFGPNPNKGKTFVDWQKKLDDKTDSRFDVINTEVDDTGESTLTLRCRECGTVRSCRSITVRQPGNIICRTCDIENRRKQKERERELDRAFIAWKKEVKRGRSLKQQALPICECGRLIVEGRKCEECKRLTRRARERNKDHIRRLREGANSERGISLEKLYDRDGGICYLCGKTCDWSDFQKVNGAFVVGGSYPTIEHVFPLCKGGSHTWDNIKLACHSCNSKKGYK